ncbi:MAG: hypothetical protein V3U22_07110 [Vicinamibacteria bacterium]
MTLGERGVGAWDETHFNEPTDVAVTPSGTAYVADGHKNQRVVKFSKDGKFLLEWGGKGEAPGEFVEPHGLGLDAAASMLPIARPLESRSSMRAESFSASGNRKSWDDPGA